MILKTRLSGLLNLMIVCIFILSLTGCGQGPTAVPTASPTPVVTVEPTPTPTPTPVPTPRVITTIRSIFPVQQPRGIDAILAEVNKKLDESILTKLELSWSAPEKYDESIAAAAAAGTIDFFWLSSDKLAGYAANKLIAPIDAPMSEFGQAIYDNIGAALFDTMKIDGKLMGIPSSGNVPLCDTGNVITYREDLRLKYSLPKPDTIAGLEQYFKTIKDNEKDVLPVCGDSIATAVMKAFGQEDFLPGTGSSVAYAINVDNTVTAMAIQDAPSFKGAAAKVREWYEAGLLPKDTLGLTGINGLLSAGTAAATGGKAFSALEQQAAVSAKVPDAVLADQPFFGSAKYLSGNGSSALCLSQGSTNPGPVVKFWAWVLASQENYDLFCYGIEGTQYELADGRIVLLDDSYSAFPETIFNNMNYRRFPKGATDDYINTLKHWNDGAQTSPLDGFVFDAAAVKNELTKVKAVYAAYGPALNTGSAETAPLLLEFGAKLKAAGQDKIIAAAKAQIDAFLASRK